MTPDPDNRLILLVDDEEDIRAVLRLPLEDLGYTVLTADNGETALELFREHQPTVVLTDIKMPGKSGIDLLQAIKAERPATEVIMITGHGDMDLAIRSLKHEATDFVIKPIHVETLEIALGRAEERIRTRWQLAEHTRRLERLVEEKEAMQNHLTSLGLLIGSVSHGIKGLLTHLDGGFYLLDRGIAQKDLRAIETAGNTLKKSAMRIKKMVQDILYYAKKRPLEPCAVQTAEFIKEVLATIAPRLLESRVDLVVDDENAPATIAMEPESMHIALVSMLDNAIDACEKDDNQSDHQVAWTIGQEEDQVVFCVQDDGIGMNEETRQEIFSLFFSSKGHGGTGLGLFIANKIVAQHKGEIRVDSTPGSGSRFVIAIPLKEPAG